MEVSNKQVEYKSFSNSESERLWMSKLRTKSDEIKKIKTAINSLTENDAQFDKYSKEIDSARSEYNSLLNRLNSIRSRNKSKKLKKEIEENRNDRAEKNIVNQNKLKFTYTDSLANKKILSPILTSKSVLFDTYIF